MTHRAEQIMAAMTTALTGLATTGANVFRGRAYDLQRLEMPALLVFQGDDEIEDGSMFHRVRSALTVNLEAMVREPAAQVDETLNAIRLEVATAIAGSVNLGLGFEIAALEQAAERPEIDAGDAPTARMRIVWAISYWRDRADPAT